VEGLPYALLEAMAVGLSVITTRVGAIPEIIEDEHHGFLIQQGDYETLAKRISQLLEDEPLGQKMGLANRRLIRDHYMPDSAMTQLVAIYDRLRGFGGAENLLSSWDEKKQRINVSCSRLPASSSLGMKDGYKEESHVNKL
jgi:hypothetical protein